MPRVAGDREDPWSWGMEHNSSDNTDGSEWKRQKLQVRFDKYARKGKCKSKQQQTNVCDFSHGDFQTPRLGRWEKFLFYGEKAPLNGMDHRKITFLHTRARLILFYI